MRIVLIMAILAAGLGWGSDVRAQSLTELRTQLQAALQRNLGRSMIDGALPHLDLETGEVTRFYPTENHEMILALGDVFVMCATLEAEDGTVTEVDYYIAGTAPRFAVIRTEIDNRAPLKALMAAGKAIRLE